MDLWRWLCRSLGQLPEDLGASRSEVVDGERIRYKASFSCPPAAWPGKQELLHECARRKNRPAFRALLCSFLYWKGSRMAPGDGSDIILWACDEPFDLDDEL